MGSYRNKGLGIFVSTMREKDECLCVVLVTFFVTLGLCRYKKFCIVNVKDGNLNSKIAINSKDESIR